MADTLVIRESQAGEQESLAGRELAFNSLEDPRILRRLKKRLSPEERDFVLALARRAARLEPASRYDLMEEAAARLRAQLEIEDRHLSAEGVVRGVAALVRTRAR